MAVVASVHWPPRSDPRTLPSPISFVARQLGRHRDVDSARTGRKHSTTLCYEERMLHDRYGLVLSTASAEARDAYVDAVDRMLASRGGIEAALAAAIAADPEFALPHAALARHLQPYGHTDRARSAVETAVRLAEHATVREQQHVEIIRRLVNGQVQEGLELTREHVADHPRDALVLSPSASVFGTIGFSGRLHREAEQLALLEPLVGHYGDDWWFLASYAFALLETGEWRRGRELAERSLELCPENAHAAHTLAHALYEAGDSDAASFLGEWLPGLSAESLLFCHLWWHQALILMSGGDHDAAWQALSEHCLPGTSSSPSINVFTDSASFLWRAELAGAPRRPAAWESVCDYYEQTLPRPIVFVDAHVGLGYAALGRTDDLAACLEQLQQLGDAGQLPAGTLAVDLTRAYGAFADDDWATVIEVLEPVIDDVVRIGGSRAQRDLVTNTLLAAYVRDGRLDAAHAFLESVHDRQPSRPIAGLPS